MNWKELQIYANYYIYNKTAYYVRILNLAELIGLTSCYTNGVFCQKETHTRRYIACLHILSHVCEQKKNFFLVLRPATLTVGLKKTHSCNSLLSASHILDKSCFCFIVRLRYYVCAKNRDDFGDKIFIFCILLILLQALQPTTL